MLIESSYKNLKTILSPSLEEVESSLLDAELVYVKDCSNCGSYRCNCQLSREERPNALSPIKTSNPNSCYELQTTSQSYDADTDLLNFFQSKNFFKLKNGLANDFDTPFDFISKNFGSHSGNPSPNPNINTKI